MSLPRKQWLDNPPTTEEIKAAVYEMLGAAEATMFSPQVLDEFAHQYLDGLIHELKYGPPPEDQVLYRFFDKKCNLLYVGITSRLSARWRQHRNDRTKPWFTDICYATLEHFGSREELQDAEWEAIQLEGPKYNIQGATGFNRLLGDKPGRAAPVIDTDANNFGRTDAIVYAVERPEPEDEPFEWQTIILGCPTCSSAEFFRIQTEDFDGQLQDRAVCEGCGRQGEFADYVAAAARLGQLGEAA